MLTTTAFEWNSAKVIVQKPNGFSQARFQQLQRLLAQHGTDGIDYSSANLIAFMLANTVSVEGSLGFPVPVKNTTYLELMAFIRGLGEADAELFQAWDTAISEAMRASNDPDLLPPEELSQKKEKTPA